MSPNTGSKRRSSRQPEMTEHLFDFCRSHDRFTCALVDLGYRGTEARFLRNAEFLYSRRHKTRDRAIAWAEAERTRLERDRRYRDDMTPLAFPTWMTAADAGRT